MTPMKLSLRQKEWIIYGLMGLTVILAILNVAVQNAGTEYLAVGGVVVAILLNFLWRRCPSCGEGLGQGRGEYCCRCGEKIDYNEK